MKFKTTRKNNFENKYIIVNIYILEKNKREEIGLPWYISKIQKWNGALYNLNKNPIIISVKDVSTPYK